jgi:hypothetical protein
MAKSARSRDGVIVIEDGDGNIVFQPGMEGTKNASINCDGTSADSDHTSDEDPNNSDSATERALGRYGFCGPPKIPSKRSSQECGSKHRNGKRAMGSKQHGAACPLKQPTCTKAMEKAGKCTAKKCTAVMKKTGKCGTNKHGKKTGKHITKKRPAGHGKKTGKHTTKKRPAGHSKQATNKHTKRPSRARRKASRKGHSRGRH